MQVEVEYVPISEQDYDIAIHILAEMFADFVKKQANTEAANGKEKLLELHPKNNT